MLYVSRKRHFDWFLSTVTAGLLLTSGCGPYLTRATPAGGAGGGGGGGVTEHRIFVTSTLYTGADFGNLAGADTACNTQAVAAGLTETYAAILSDSVVNANSRITISGPVYNYSDPTTKLLVAANSADFWDAGGVGHTNGITYTEDYQNYAGAKIWTGTLVDGTSIGPGATAKTCTDWSSVLTDSIEGIIGSTDANWTNDGAGWINCGTTLPIYCISQ